MRRTLLALISAFVFAWCRGTCPDVDPQAHLDVDKLLGHWFIVQKTGAHHPCLTFNLTANIETGAYRIIETTQTSKIVNALGLQHERHSRGKLTLSDSGAPGVMDLNLPLRLRTFKLTIFATDYDNYLAFVTCKKGFAFTNKPQVTIASRTPSLESHHLEPIYANLLKYSINPYVIETVKQFECAEPGKKGVIVKAASDVVGAVRGAFGSIAGVFSPGKKVSDDLDPEVTGEYEIDVRAGVSQ
ncbi:hypothetical protein PPYR_02873 [Photinus pyralis]|uniref:Lipocalin/cytosolic fatty-acid binding domain-containing protein n=1 Tax=Photinus pyralis TaxID=7054 RepID=A0A1Y1LXU2_PHOPY|nr:uncharacterized protein LOC116161198 [Photinus pyralis]KAB0791073.1 hypothetical protein PPYR_02873 [Photinus pyralis]